MEEHGRIKYDTRDTLYFGAKGVIREEFRYIRYRRDPGAHAEQPEAELSEADEKQIRDRLTGLALSGGGIRSASFCLGVLQALSHNRWLEKIDYLSTVSGGGYIGSSVSWLLSQKLGETKDEDMKRFGLGPKHFPYGSYPMAGTDPETLGESGQHDSVPMEDAPGNVTSVVKGKLLRYLRQRTKYLTPGDGINAMSLLAVVLRGTLLSLLVYFGLFALVFILLDRSLLQWQHQGINGALWLAIAGGVLFAVCALIYSLVARFLSSKKPGAAHQRAENDPVPEPGPWPWYKRLFHCLGNVLKGRAYRMRQCYEWGAGKLLTLVFALLIIGVIPHVYDLLQQWTAVASSTVADFEISGTRASNGAMQFSGSLDAPVQSTDCKTGTPCGSPAWIGALSTLIGALSGILAFFKSGSIRKGRVPMGLVVAVGTVTLWFGLLLLAYHLSQWLWRWLGADTVTAVIGIGVFAVLVFVIGVFANINYISIHRYYRDRLMEAFMPDVDLALAGEIATRAANRADRIPLHAYPGGRERSAIVNQPSPYHLINTNVVLESSFIPKFAGRGGDNFILSPRYCGSNATDWLPTRSFMEGRMNLPTAMAISGAAVNPGTGIGGEGVTRQPLLSMLMGLLNIRLGYWAPNPRYNGQGIPNLFSPGLSDIFMRSNLHEQARYVQLSDGGHFENLALYELVRRHARVIIVCDAGADPAFNFTDLANAIEKIRVDFGVVIDWECGQLQSLIPRIKKPDEEVKCADRGYSMHTIHYPGGDEGVLLYIKTTFFEQLSADLYGYKRTHPEFPDEPTSDQFFDEKQFEAYRELGFQTAWRMMNDTLVTNDDRVKELFPVS